MQDEQLVARMVIDVFFFIVIIYHEQSPTAALKSSQKHYSTSTTTVILVLNLMSLRKPCSSHFNIDQNTYFYYTIFLSAAIVNQTNHTRVFYEHNEILLSLEYYRI